MPNHVGASMRCVSRIPLALEAVCLLCLVIIFAQPQHFQRAAESMGEPIGKPAAETE